MPGCSTCGFELTRGLALCPRCGSLAPSADAAPPSSSPTRRLQAGVAALLTIATGLVVWLAVRGPDDRPTALATTSATTARGVSGASTSQTVRTSASTTSTTSMTSSTTTDEPTPAPLRPDADPELKIRTFKSFDFTVDCPAVGDEGSWDLGDLGQWDNWFVVRAADYLALVDRSTQSTQWCSTMALGGTTAAPIVTSDSPVGRPDYTPALDDNTLAAAWPGNAEPDIAIHAGRLWVVQPIEIVRPDIQSQQRQSYSVLLGLDDTGKVSWLRQLDQPPGITGAGIQIDRDATTGELLVVQTWSDDDGVGHLRLGSLDASTGLVAKWRSPGVDWDLDDRVFIGGTIVHRTRSEEATGTAYGMAVRRVANWTRLAAIGPWDRDRRFRAIMDRLVIQGPTIDDGSPTNKVLSYSYADGSGRTITAPFPIDLDRCVGNGASKLVCTGTTGDEKDAIAVLDVAQAKVDWWWKTGSPDPKTKVPRAVPRDLAAWGDYIYGSNAEGVRYVMDVATGADVGLETDIREVTNAYGEISIFGNRVSWDMPLP